jgi:hypothetical protein
MHRMGMLLFGELAQNADHRREADAAGDQDDPLRVAPLQVNVPWGPSR